MDGTGPPCSGGGRGQGGPCVAAATLDCPGPAEMPQLALSICPVCLGLVRSFLFLCVLSHLISPLMRVGGVSEEKTFPRPAV